MDIALGWQRDSGVFIPVICAANDKRPGGDWETGVQGYEERLCRRSSLAATLATPAPDGAHSCNFPIPSTGGIYSPCVGKSYVLLCISSLPFCIGFVA